MLLIKLAPLETGLSGLSGIGDSGDSILNIGGSYHLHVQSSNGTFALKMH